MGINIGGGVNGAMSGASMGSMAGPIGTIGGAIIGGAMGLFSKKSKGGGGYHAPSLDEIARQYAKAYPTYFGVQKKYAPQEAQLQLDLLRDYGGQMAQAQYDISNDIYPYTTGLQEQLAQQASEGINAETPQWMQDKYMSNMRGVLGDQVLSGVGADAQSVGLMNFNKQYNDYFRDLGLSLTSRQPLQQAGTPQYNNIAGGFTPGSAINYEYGVYNGMPAAQGASGSGIGSMLGNINWGQMIGSIGGMFGGSKGGGMSFPGETSPNMISTSSGMGYRV